MVAVKSDTPARRPYSFSKNGHTLSNLTIKKINRIFEVICPECEPCPVCPITCPTESTPTPTSPMTPLTTTTKTTTEITTTFFPTTTVSPLVYNEASHKLFFIQNKLNIRK